MMKAGLKDVILFFIFIIKHVTASQSLHIDTSDLLSQLNLGSKNQSPVIVILNDEKKRPQSGLTDPSDDDVSADEDEGLNDDNNFVEKEAKEQVKSILYNYLRSSPEDGQDDVRPSLLRALRKRCQAARKCIKKCPPKKRHCVPKCKKVFDEEDLCNPPKKKNKCGCQNGQNGNYGSYGKYNGYGGQDGQDGY